MKAKFPGRTKPGRRKDQRTNNSAFLFPGKPAIFVASPKKL
jgi:hypothetical protein